MEQPLAFTTAPGLEPILEPRSLLKGNQRATKLHERQIVVAFALPSDEQTAEAVVPGVGALHDPASWFAIDTAHQRRLSATADVRSDSASTHRGLRVGIIVALVQAQMLRTTRATRRTNDDTIEHLADHPLVVNVGARNTDRERHPAAIGQDVPLHPAFRAVRRVGTGEVPPFGAFTVALSSEVHSHWMPRRPS